MARSISGITVLKTMNALKAGFPDFILSQIVP
jgi:hypothetical protein